MSESDITKENFITNDTEDDAENEVTEDIEIENDEDTENTEQESAAIDYEELARRDMEELTSIFPHLSGKKSIVELDNPLRYAALRDLGLSPKEAFLATSEKGVRYDTRSHLKVGMPKAAGSPAGAISHSELSAARELFDGLSDREIQSLYKRVTK